MDSKYSYLFTKSKTPAMIVTAAGLVTVALAQYNLHGFKTIDQTAAYHNVSYQTSNYVVMTMGLTAALSGIYLWLHR